MVDCLLSGVVMPRPPRQTGRAMTSHSASLKALRPVRDVRKRCLIASSSGNRRSPMSGILSWPRKSFSYSDHEKRLRRQHGDEKVPLGRGVPLPGSSLQPYYGRIPPQTSRALCSSEVSFPLCGDVNTCALKRGCCSLKFVFFHYQPGFGGIGKIAKVRANELQLVPPVCELGPAVTSSANQTCCTCSFVSLWISGMMALPYIAMAKGFPCVVLSWDMSVSPSMESCASSQ